MHCNMSDLRLDRRRIWATTRHKLKRCGLEFQCNQDRGTSRSRLEVAQTYLSSSTSYDWEATAATNHHDFNLVLDICASSKLYIISNSGTRRWRCLLSLLSQGKFSTPLTCPVNNSSFCIFASLLFLLVYHSDELFSSPQHEYQRAFARGRLRSALLQQGHYTKEYTSSLLEVEPASIS